jgi:ureidoacrylate peracid hydrolase
VHNIDIPQWITDRVIKKRGAEHVFTDLDPARTALIVIDMQNAFMLPGVGFADIKTAPADRPEHQPAGRCRAFGRAPRWCGSR